MAKRHLILEELDLIFNILTQHPDGLAVEAIEATVKLGIDRRTLQRRLDALITDGRIKATKRGRATRYAVSSQSGASATTPNPKEPTQGNLFVPLSKASSAIVKQVTGPLGSRKPVGYHRAFLDGYRPNQTSYLTAAEKTRLADLGITSMPTGAAGTYAQHILQRLLIDLSWNSSRLEGNT
jgi:hypothetical protein